MIKEEYTNEQNLLPELNGAVTDEDFADFENNDISEESDSETPDSVEVIGVQFQRTGKIYYFDPQGEQYQPLCGVIVETMRGIEYGTCRIANRFVPGSQIVPPLRRALRAATSEDDDHNKFNSEKEKEASEICLERIRAHGLQMNLIDVEYTFDNTKLLFYFTAEGRVDFRDLVKDLASVFRTRIEMRQVGIRDEAKLLGGLGACGRPFCCATFLSDFGQVSIHMAKEQNLSLNSNKISGSCGRLMCCLRFEYDTYLDLLRQLPPIESRVATPDGVGVVIELNALAALVKVKLESQDNGGIKLYDSALVSTDPQKITEAEAGKFIPRPPAAEPEAAEEEAPPQPVQAGLSEDAAEEISPRTEIGGKTDADESAEDSEDAIPDESDDSDETADNEEGGAVKEPKRRYKQKYRSGGKNRSRNFRRGNGRTSGRNPENDD